MSDSLSNPFTNFKYWIKEETLDLHALLDAISWQNNFESQKTKLQGKIKSAQTNLEKLKQGKKTLGTFFKSSSSKADEITKLTVFITQADKDVVNLEKLVALTTINLCKNVIPTFKKSK